MHHLWSLLLFSSYQEMHYVWYAIVPDIRKNKPCVINYCSHHTKKFTMCDLLLFLPYKEMHHVWSPIVPIIPRNAPCVICYCHIEPRKKWSVIISWTFDQSNYRNLTRYFKMIIPPWWWLVPSLRSKEKNIPIVSSSLS